MRNDQRDIIEKNTWTDIILFDAARYDIFKKLYPQYVKGRLRKLWNGNVTYTYDWMKRNIRVPYPDVSYYVCAPQVKNEVPFGHLDYTYPRQFGRILGHREIEMDMDEPWHEAFSVNARVINDPHRIRAFVHYMAPHEPYVDEDGMQVIITHDTEPKRIHALYTHKYHIAFKAAVELLPHLGEHVIITSDHGECLGDCGRVSHGGTEYHDHLVYVPWFKASGIR